MFTFSSLSKCWYTYFLSEQMLICKVFFIEKMLLHKLRFLWVNADIHWNWMTAYVILHILLILKTMHYNSPLHDYIILLLYYSGILICIHYLVIVNSASLFYKTHFLLLSLLFTASVYIYVYMYKELFMAYRVHFVSIKELLRVWMPKIMWVLNTFFCVASIGNTPPLSSCLSVCLSYKCICHLKQIHGFLGTHLLIVLSNHSIIQT